MTKTNAERAREVASNRENLETLQYLIEEALDDKDRERLPTPKEFRLAFERLYKQRKDPHITPELLNSLHAWTVSNMRKKSQSISEKISSAVKKEIKHQSQVAEIFLSSAEATKGETVKTIIENYVLCERRSPDGLSMHYSLKRRKTDVGNVI